MKSNFFKVARKLDCQTWVAQWDKIKATDDKGSPCRDMDIRAFQLDGFELEAKVMNTNPISGRPLRKDRWFIFAVAA